MRHISIDKIEVGDRQRKAIDKKLVRKLAESISTRTLLHPLVLSAGGGKKLKLVVGQRRLEAIKLLHSENVLFSCNEEIIPPGEAPYLFISELSDIELMQAELEENLYRVDLSWQERTLALARIHEAKQALNPSQTAKDTATEIASKTDRAPRSIENELARSRILAQHVDNPRIQAARSAREAWNILHKDSQERMAAALSRKTEATTLSPHTLIRGDLVSQLPKLAGSDFDLVIADPPYGYAMNKNVKNLRSRQAVHTYDDSPDTAINLAKHILRLTPAVCAKRANLFLFIAHENFSTLLEFAKQQGWSTWPRPIIWWKANEGISPWGLQGFRFCYEVILYCTRGQRGLRRPHVDVLERYKVTHDKRHAAEKPEDLYELLIDLTCPIGSKILDPCCGSGTIFPSATQTKCVATGIEMDPMMIDVATNRMTPKKEEDDEPR